MELNLVRPIVFFDLETTGIDTAKDRIVEISLLKIMPTGEEISKTWLINPTIPIDPKATAVHGIKDEDVKDKETFKQLAKTIASFFDGADLGGYNSNKFDIPMLAEEFMRAEVDIDLKRKNFIDVMIIFQKMEPRTLSAAYQFYCQKEMINAHSAEADTRATYEIFKSQLGRYANTQFKDSKGEITTPVVNNIDELAKFTSHGKTVDYAGRIVYDDKNIEVFNFGKYKGQSVEEVLKKDAGYYSWMMQGDFPQYTKKVLTEIKLRGMK